MQTSNTVLSPEDLAKALGGKRAEAQFVACSEGVGMTGPVLKIKNKNHFSVVPDNLLENKSLSLQARAVAGWLVGRSDNFEIRISSLKRILGITDFVWVKIRKELEKNGYWKSSRTFDQKTGNIVWEHIFSVDSTIPNFTMDGGTIDGIAMDGGTINGKPGDIILNCNQDVTNIYSRHGGAPWREKQPFPTKRLFGPTNSETARKPWKRCNGLSPYS
jgi:hypothetical protein